MNNPAANSDQAGFTGHIKDSATGLNYMQARYYDPLIGRFLSIDPVGFSPNAPGMFNRYAYTLNDPVNMTDPDGEVPWVIGAVINMVAEAIIIAAEVSLEGEVSGVEMAGRIAVAGVSGAAGVGVGQKIAKVAKLAAVAKGSGKIGSSVKGGAAGGAAAGATTELTQETGNMAFGGEGPTVEGVIFNAAAGAVGGGVSGFGAGLADDLVSTGQKSADEVASFAAQTAIAGEAAAVAADTAYEQVEELNGK